MNWLLRHRWLLIFAAWTVYGVMMAVNAYSRNLAFNRPVPFVRLLTSEMIYSYLWFAATPLIVWLARRYPLRWSIRPVLTHLVTMVLIGAAIRAGWELLIPGLVGRKAYPWTSIIQVAFTSMDFGMLNYALVVMAAYLADYSRRHREELERAAKLEAQLAQAQLHALKMQVHPHFLFNTLHAISELIHESPAAAESMIVRLSEFLRMTLERAGTAEVTLREEVEFVTRYLEIEKVRFDDRLQVEYAIEPQVLEAEIPNLILQPLVENAIKHGISRTSQPGVLRLQAASHNGDLRLSVSDTGPGLDITRQKPLRVGVGLSNTKARLARLYPGKHAFAMSNDQKGGFSVTIHLPLRLRGKAVS